jgi:hypothetical protein
MGDWYTREIVAPGKQPLAVLFVSFVVTFLFIRFSTRMIRAQVKWWPGNVQPGGLHLHHVVFGIVVVMMAGAGGFSSVGNISPWAEVFAGLFGVGAALILDEFALVLHLRDVYWSEQGRTSVDAVFLAVAVFGLLLTGSAPLGVNSVAVDNARYAAWNYVFAVLTNAALVLVTLFKGKVWTGLLGIFLPFLALVGAIRLARPTSAWARWRYRPDSRKAGRAIRREARQRARWVRWRHRAEDTLAGRPSS